jgi:hypothetical protein
VWASEQKEGYAKAEETVMRIAKGHMVALGYGKYFRSDSIVGLEPIEEGRGPGKRTTVYIEHLPMPMTASRSEGAILRDLVELPKEVTRTREISDMLRDILETIQDINPMLRSIIRDQGHWDLDRLEERISEVFQEEEA